MSREPNSASEEHAVLLRRSLAANAIFSGASGALLVAATGPVAALLDWAAPSATAVLLGIGAGLLAFATVLVATSRASRPNEAVIRGIVAMDVGWVLGSAVLLALGLAPSGRGAVVIGAVAAVVAVLAAGQALGLARVRRTDQRQAT